MIRRPTPSDQWPVTSHENGLRILILGLLFAARAAQTSPEGQSSEENLVRHIETFKIANCDPKANGRRQLPEVKPIGRFLGGSGGVISSRIASNTTLNWETIGTHTIVLADVRQRNRAGGGGGPVADVSPVFHVVRPSRSWRVWMAGSVSGSRG